MAVSPPTIRYAEAQLRIDNPATFRRITAQNAAGTSFPNGHISSNTFDLSITEEDGGAGAPTGEWAVAIVEDATDVSGNYTNVAGTALSSSVLAYAVLGTGGALPSTVSIGTGGLNATIAKGGTFRIVIIAADSAANARRASAVDQGAASAEYHFDSDVNDADGDLNTITASEQETGAMMKRIKVDAFVAENPSDNQKYGDTPNLDLSVVDSGGNASMINPKNIRLAITDETSGATRRKTFDVSPNTSGDVDTSTYNVDTDFAATQTDYYLHAGVNDTLGNATTPAGQQPALFSIQTPTGLTTVQRAWTIFDDTPNSGFTNVSNEQTRTTSNDLTVGSGINLKKSVGGSDGVNVYGDSGFSVSQDLFRRTQPTATAHAIPRLESFVVDAYGNALTSKSVIVNVLRHSDSASENQQTLTTNTSPAGRIRWNYTIASTHTAFNRFRKTSPDDPASPPASFSNLNKSGSDATGSYPDPKSTATLSYDGAQPAYPKHIKITGNAYSGTKEPTDQENSQFGVNSEIMFEGMWTGDLANATVDANNAPSGIASRTKNLGTGSLRFKVCTEINEGTGLISVAGEFNPKDVAGRLYSVTAAGDKGKGRYAAWNSTSSSRQLAPTSDQNANYHLDTTLGYNAGTGGDNGFQALAASTDPSTISIYYGYSFNATQQALFDLESGSQTVGFTGDTGNYGFKKQIMSFVAVDPDLLVSVTTENLITPNNISNVRISAQFSRILPDGSRTTVKPDNPPSIYIAKDGGNDTAMSFTLDDIAMTAVAPDGNGKSPDWEYDFAAPDDGSYSVFISGIVSGSRPTAAGVAKLVIGRPDNTISLAPFVGELNLEDRHWQSGDEFAITLLALRATEAGIGAVGFSEEVGDEPTVIMLRVNNGTTESLQADGETWAEGTYERDIPIVAGTPTFTFTEAQTANWTPNLPIFLFFKAVVQDTDSSRSPRSGFMTFYPVGTNNPHNANAFDPTGLFK